MAQPDFQHRRRRQGQENAGKTEKLSTCHDGEDNRHRVQPDPVSYQLRRKPQAFEHLSSEKNDANAEQDHGILKLQVGRDRRRQQAEDETEIRHETDETRHDADR